MGEVRKLAAKEKKPVLVYFFTPSSSMTGERRSYRYRATPYAYISFLNPIRYLRQ